MKFSNDRGTRNYQPPQHCELCKLLIDGKSYHDIRSNGALRGKGKVLCNKCYGLLLNMPAEKALEVLEEASAEQKK